MEKPKKSTERMNAIGNKIKELRIKKGLTSYENFAVHYDIDRKYYWSVEKGRNISLEYLFKILDIHEITLEEFFKDMT